MVEVELKVEVKDSQRVERLLESLGARFEGQEQQLDIYYSAPHRDFKITDEALRLRRSFHSSRTEECYLTYKGPKLDALSKSREELNVMIEGWEEAQSLLQSLGFIEVGRVSKLRRGYRLTDFVLSLDQVEGLGNFLEVETRAEGSYDQILEQAFELLKKLGLDQHEVIRESYLELLCRSREKRLRTGEHEDRSSFRYPR